MFGAGSRIATKILLEQDILLEDITGWFSLTGVDFTTSRVYNDYTEDDAQIMTLILNDISFSFIEDPDDGYRSTLDKVIVGEFQEVKNTFSPVNVYFTYVNEDREDMIYGALTAMTINPYILRIGTDHTDDYYPTYTAEWDPRILGRRDLEL